MNPTTTSIPDGLRIDHTPPSPADARRNRPTKWQLLDTARSVLLGEARTSEQLKELCKNLESEDLFDYASEVLLVSIAQDKKEGIPVPLAAYQTLAKYIYKDDSLSAQYKFDRALRELDAADPLADSDNCQTLGLAGAIYKRKWQSDHQYKHLALSRFYYSRGFKLWKEYIGAGNSVAAAGKHNYEGWNAINYAYILELEAINALEETGHVTGFRNVNADGLLEAQQTRVYILQQFLNDPFGKSELLAPNPAPWVLATIAEAYFGLCCYDLAFRYIGLYKGLMRVRPWEMRSFSQEMFSVAYLQQARERLAAEANPALVFNMPGEACKVDQKSIQRCLAALDIDDSTNDDISNDGKSGLAFSGGGFRASLFHIGVLAAMAERDELKDIEVISCVSGGSIIGAYYYLKLKILLESHKDEEINKQHYIRLVQEMEVDFLEGVQKNLRMRIFSNLGRNFRMLDDNYSRTNRLGELYEEFLYRKIWEKDISEKRKQGQHSKYEAILKKNGGRIFMSDLHVEFDEPFSINNDNWKRKNKVPKLILNATSVNTGHNWQFTASWMGEPAAGIISDIDVKSRLRRMYYADAPEGYQQFPLGSAVGASSCVPVMFEPLPMNDLYPGISLQLIDGGLHDNQGIASILDEECKNVFISDASGQLPTNDGGVSGLLPLFLRADNILQERLRELQFLDMKERRSTTLINRLYSVHLKNGISTQSVNWKNCTDPPRTISFVDPSIKDKNLLPYGVLRGTQQLISEIRTDLDAFHDIEAYALMYDGYAQTKDALVHSAEPTGNPTDWKFLAIADYLKNPAKAATIESKLKISSKVPFKVYHMLGGKKLGITLLILVALTVGYVLFRFPPNIPGEVSFSIGAIGMAAAIAIIGILFKPASVLLNPKGYLRKKLVTIGIAVLGWLLFSIYLYIFNPIYLAKGKLKK